MIISPHSLLTFFVFSVAVNASTSESPTPLSEAEAMAIIRAEREREETSERERLERILNIHSIDQNLVNNGENSILMRRVGWQPLTPITPPSGASEGSTGVPVPNFAETEQYSVISIGATVYDDIYTRITWRNPVERNAEQFTIWTNVNFKYLRTVFSFEHDDVRYGYFGITEEADTTAFVMDPATGEKYFLHPKPDWIPEPSDFPTGGVGYLILANSEDKAIPDLLYQQMDALLVHYSHNEAELQIAWQRSEALRKARKILDETEPVNKEETVINFWPIQSRAEP